MNIVKPIKLVVNIENKDVTFFANEVPTFKLIELLELQDEIEEGGITQAETIYKRIDFITGVFNDPRLTREVFLSGVQAPEAFDIMANIESAVMGIDENAPLVENESDQKM